MALTYRSPIEEVLTSFTSSEQSEIARDAVQNLKGLESHNHALFCYAMSATAKMKLCESGIYLSPFSYTPHSHPVCKTLENYSLYSVVCPLLDHSFYLVGIKSSKLMFLKSRNRLVDMATCINRLVTSRDKIRYGSDFVVAPSGTGSIKGLCGSRKLSATLRDLLPKEIVQRQRSLFFHDELHYWSPECLEVFLDEVRPKTVLATIVIPPELLIGSRESMNRWCYDYEIHGQNLHYYPDGVRTEGYVQPLECAYLLKTSKIITKSGLVYCIDLLSSKYSHHVISITQGDAIVPSCNSFSGFDAIGTTFAKKMDPSGLPCYPISYTTVIKLYTYLASLNSPDLKSAVAKLRQLVQEPTAFEVKFAQEFASMYIKNGVDFKLFMPDTWRDFKNSIRNLMPLLLQKKYKPLMRASFTDFVHNLCPLSFSVDCEFLDYRPKGVIAHCNALHKGYLCKMEELEPSERAPCYITERRRHPYADNKKRKLKLVPGLESRLGEALSLCYELPNVRYLSAESGFEDLKTLLKPLYVRLMVLYGPAFLQRVFRLALRFRDEQIHLERAARGKAKQLTWEQNEVPPVPTACEEIAQEDANIATALVSTQNIEPLQIAKFNCVCAVAIPWARALEVGFLRVDLPDKLHNRMCGFYSRGAFDYHYNGGKHKGIEWLPGFDIFLNLNGHDQNYFNCVLIQRYDEGGKIGFHADDEKIFEEGGKILTVNVEGSCNFRFQCAQGECGFLLDGPTQFIMPEFFQGTHKHAVLNCSAGRLSATFRRAKVAIVPCTEELHKDSMSSEGAESGDERTFVEVVSALGVRSIVSKGASHENYGRITVSGADNMCFWNCLSFYLNVDALVLKSSLLESPLLLGVDVGCSAARDQLGVGCMAEDEVIQLACRIFSTNIKVVSSDLNCTYEYTIPEPKLCITLLHESEHFSPAVFKNDCFVVAIAATFDRSVEELYRVLAQPKFKKINDALSTGEGLDLNDMIDGFELFNIKAHIMIEGRYTLLNEAGEINGYYHLADEHIVASPPFSGQQLASKVTLGRKGVNANSTFNVLATAGTTVSYTCSVDRAHTLEGSMLRGCTGVISSTLFSGAQTRLKDCTENKNKDVVVITGTFGAGKTSLIKRAIVHLNGVDCGLHFVLPRKTLADNLRETLNITRSASNNKRNIDTGVKPAKSELLDQRRNHQIFVRTFETFLTICKRVRKRDIIVIDEMQLYPPGYLDLVLLLLHDEVRVIVMGDPCQSDYDSENDRHVFMPLENDLINLLSDRDYKYNKLSRRFKNKIFEGRLPCVHRVEDFVKEEPFLLLQGLDGKVPEIREFAEVFLVASFVEKNFVRAIIGEDTNVLTFGESTGMTFARGAIFITESSLKVSEVRWVTALSRFSDNLAFVNMLECDHETLARKVEHRALGKFLMKKASIEDMVKMLPGKPIFKEGFLSTYGKNLGVRESKLVGDPWLKSEIFLGQEIDEEVVEISEVCKKTEWFKTHLPRCELECMRARWSDRIMLKESREYKFRDMITEQFTESHSKQKGAHLTNQAERYESIYPRHRANDTLTFLMAVKKRLRFSKPHLECAKLKEAEPYGAFLLKEFLKHVPLKAQGRVDLMEKAQMAFEDKKTSKSAATIENHSGRSCSDWLLDVGLVFSKSQICTKWDNRFRVAKAAQSIVCFQHSVLCRFAPYMRYIEMKVLEVLPKNFYIHSGKGLNELNDWVVRGRFEGICTESDYEAFDASQDHYIMSFELALMRYLGLPKDLINDYIYIKTHLGCKMGALAIMRFSGEASTFLFNTLANMLFTFLRYDVRGDEYICFAGDDMCAAKRLRVKETHSAFLGKLRLKAKVDFTRRPTFCGWNLTEFGIYKKPQLVMERICIAKEMNNLKNCIDNYAIEVSFAYLKGERAVNHMNEEELEAFYNCVRVIIKNKHIMKSDVRLLFENSIV
ncbi:replicase [Allium carlavirus A]|nr:replicase [Allium carlavirus A]